MVFLDFISLGWFLFVCFTPPGLISVSILVSLGQNTNSKEFTFPIVTSLLEVASLVAGSVPWLCSLHWWHFYASQVAPLPIQPIEPSCSPLVSMPLLERCCCLNMLTESVMWFVKFKQNLRKRKELHFLMVPNDLQWTHNPSSNEVSE